MELVKKGWLPEGEAVLLISWPFLTVWQTESNDFPIRQTRSTPPGTKLVVLYKDALLGGGWKAEHSPTGTDPKGWKNLLFLRSRAKKIVHLFLLCVCAAKSAPTLTILVRSCMRSRNRCGSSRSQPIVSVGISCVVLWQSSFFSLFKWMENCTWCYIICTGLDALSENMQTQRFLTLKTFGLKPGGIRKRREPEKPTGPGAVLSKETRAACSVQRAVVLGGVHGAVKHNTEQTHGQAKG